MFLISFQNSAGELDSRTVKTGAEVPAAIAEMIGTTDTWYSGDKIVVTDMDEEG